MLGERHWPYSVLPFPFEIEPREDSETVQEYLQKDGRQRLYKLGQVPSIAKKKHDERRKKPD